MEKTYNESEFKAYLKQELDKDSARRPWVLLSVTAKGDLWVQTFSNKIKLIFTIMYKTNLSSALELERNSAPVWFHRDGFDNISIPPNLFSTKQWKECEQAYSDAYELGMFKVSNFDEKA